MIHPDKQGAFDDGSLLEAFDDELISSSWKKEPTTKDVIEEARFWDQIGWARVVSPENQNMDLIPSRFTIGFRCAECGSVWGSFLAVGFTAPKICSGVARWNGREMEVLPDLGEILDTRAARIQCLEGHTFDHDFFTGRTRKHEVPVWQQIALGGIALVAAAYAVMGLAMKK